MDTANRKGESRAQCLICSQATEATGGCGPFPSSFLEKELNVFFILKHVLELPSEQLERFLRYSPHSPGEWVKICGNCVESYVDKCKRIFGELMEVKRRFNVARRQLIEVVKRSFDGERKGEEEDGANEPFILDIWKETRKFVLTNTYGYSIDDPFINGDLMAHGKLTGTEQSRKNISDRFSSLSHSVMQSKDFQKISCNSHVDGGSTNDIKLGTTFVSERNDEVDGTIDLKQERMTDRNEEVDTWSDNDEDNEESSDSADDTWDPKPNSPFPMKLDLSGDEGTNSPKPSPQAVVKRKLGSPGSPGRYNGSSNNKVNQRQDQLKYTCTFEGCGKKFLKENQLLDHEKIHNNRQYECRVCGLSFQSMSSHSEHLQTHQPLEEQPLLKCDLCPVTFSRSKSLKSHMMKVHWGTEIGMHGPSANPKPVGMESQQSQQPTAVKKKKAKKRKVEYLKCDQCTTSKIFYSCNTLRQHQMQVHKTNFYTCSKCDWKTTHSNYLPDHMKRYHGDEQDLKDLTCPTCQKVFTYGKRLREHIAQVHGNRRKKFVCEHCGRELADKGTYLHHVGAVHGMGRFTCSFEGCGKTFYGKSQLMDHAGAHNPQHQCHICGKKLATKRKFGEHLKLHELGGLKPFQCDVCLAKFTRKYNLFAHSRTVHKVNCLDPNLGTGVEMT